MNTEVVELVEVCCGVGRREAIGEMVVGDSDGTDAGHHSEAPATAAISALSKQNGSGHQFVFKPPVPVHKFALGSSGVETS